MAKNISNKNSDWKDFVFSMKLSRSGRGIIIKIKITVIVASFTYVMIGAIIILKIINTPIGKIRKAICI